MVTAADRIEALEVLGRLAEEQPFLHAEKEASWVELCGEYLPNIEELADVSLRHAADEFFDMWFVLDEELDDGRPIDLLLALNDEIGRGARAYLETLAGTFVGLYEVVETVPGESILLTGLTHTETVEVSERTASKELEPHALLAARIVSKGVSGRPEMERGVLQFPRHMRAHLVEYVAEMQADLLASEADRAETHCEVARVLFQAWLSALRPTIPELCNTDDEPLSFDEVGVPGPRRSRRR